MYILISNVWEQEEERRGTHREHGRLPSPSARLCQPGNCVSKRTGLWRGCDFEWTGFKDATRWGYGSGYGIGDYHNRIHLSVVLAPLSKNRFLNLRTCDLVVLEISASPFCTSLDRFYNYCPLLSSLEDRLYEGVRIPSCPACRDGFLKPSVVFFGGAIQEVRRHLNASAVEGVHILCVNIIWNHAHSNQSSF